MEIFAGCPARICFNCVSLKLAVTQMFWLSRGTMVISCWPTETFWPGCTDLCPTRPLTGATIVVYCKFNCAWSLRLRGLCPGDLHGNLLGPGFSVPYSGLSLHNFGARLSNCLFGRECR